ncbi:MAG: hypothetical protein F6J97_20805 [Leptolyngbya sp. SIO4C1]|nr:hypothetical protein [Leptolyngbya sp. SIO4C1]
MGNARMGLNDFPQEPVPNSHPLITKLNSLNVEEDDLEAHPLIYQCFEEGVFDWFNPKFLSFLGQVIRDLVVVSRLELYQMRGVMYARYVLEHMPKGIDDSLLEKMQEIADRPYVYHVNPSPKLNYSEWLAFCAHGYYYKLRQQTILRQRLRHARRKAA